MTETRAQRPTLLIIEDDPGIRESLELGLGFEGYAVLGAATASEGLRLLREHEIDAVILDVLLPGTNGYSVLDEIRSPHNPKREVPVLMLTALDEIEDRVRGLRRGADDYMVKPFALAELVARIEALQRRQHTEQPLTFYGLSLYPERFEARRDGLVLVLSPKAFLLLQVLVKNAGHIVSKEALMAQVWDGEVEPNTLEVHLSSLRRTLGDPPLIRTVRGYGYLLGEP